jgi:hypothetical protein
MSTSRHIIRPARIIKRHVSSSSSSSSSTKAHDPIAVPPPKMRALIDLYHQTPQFITRANLSRKIDDAFLGPDSDTAAVSNPGLRAHSSLPFLKSQVHERRRMPRITEWNAVASVGGAAHRSANSYWSGQKSARELAVEAALYGTYERVKGKPGLGVLEEEGPVVQRQLEEDRRSLLGWVFLTALVLRLC